MRTFVDGRYVLQGILLLTAILALTASLVRADDVSVGKTSSVGIALFEQPDVARTTLVKYAATIKGKLETPEANLDLNSSAKFEFEQRRFPSDSTEASALRAIRRFQTAETSSLYGRDHKNSVILPAQSRVIHVQGSELQLIQFSPDVRLTRPQVDLLQFPCDPLAVTGLLPGRNLKDKSEKWNVDAWVVPMLSGIEISVSQTATCLLKSFSETEAVIAFDCHGTGAVTGSATEVTLQGEMTLDLKDSLIRRFKATMTEKRGRGTVSPGLDVIVEIQWTQDVASPVVPLPDVLSEQLPGERQLLLTLVTPWRLLLLHDRDWHIFHETSELVMLRRLHYGALLAQCNIAAAPLMAPGKFTSESDYVQEVERAVMERGGTVTASVVQPNQNGWRIHHVRAMGEESKKMFVWDYFLCTTKSGEQFSLLFWYAKEDSEAFSGVADQMLKSLTTRSVRPKIALPR